MTGVGEGFEEKSSLLLRYEAKLREKESEATGVTPEGINRAVFELSRKGYYKKEAIDEIKKLLSEIKHHIAQFFDTPMADAALSLSGWTNNLSKDIYLMCSLERVPGVGMMYRCRNFPALKYYSTQRDVSMEVGRCGFIAEHDTEVSLIRAVDSFTNCMHTFALKIPKVMAETRSAEFEDTLCYGWVDSKYSGVAEAFCREFTKAVEENELAYASADVGEQEAHISRNRIDVEVGGAAGHRTKIFLEEDKVRVEYEDHWSTRVDIFEDVMKGVGFECEQNLFGLSAKCRGKLDEESIRKIARVLSAMPSLDIHFEEYENSIADDIYDEAYEEVREAMEEEISREAWELARERARDEAMEAVPCVVSGIEDYVERGSPTYSEIVENCLV